MTGAHDHDKDNFLWEPDKITFKFHRNRENTRKIIMRKISFCDCMNLRLLKFVFSDSLKNLFLELFHITYYICSPR